MVKERGKVTKALAHFRKALEIYQQEVSTQFGNKLLAKRVIGLKNWRDKAKSWSHKVMCSVPYYTMLSMIKLNISQKS